MRFSTIVPRLGGFPPTLSQPLNVEQKYAAATTIAKADHLTPQSTKDTKGVEMILVPSGCFLMGDASISDSLPVSEQCFDQPFWIDRYLATNEQFDRLGGIAAGRQALTDPNRPRERI